MGAHQTHGRGERVWLTPPEIVHLLGPFDLDPCFGPPRPWDTAERHFGPEDDGLVQPWEGHVWLNPPYDAVAEDWLRRLADHGDGMALIFARTETEAFHRQVWRRADALLFLEGRLFFHRPDGQRAKHNGGAPSVLIAYGQRAVEKLERKPLKGAFVQLGGAT